MVPVLPLEPEAPVLPVAGLESDESELVSSDVSGVESEVVVSSGGGPEHAGVATASVHDPPLVFGSGSCASQTSTASGSLSSPTHSRPSSHEPPGRQGQPAQPASLSLEFFEPQPSTSRNPTIVTGSRIV